MYPVATFEWQGKPWIAEQVYGESPRHLEIAAGAHYKRKPYCRNHLLGLRQGNSNPIPETLRNVLITKKLDVSSDFDVVVVHRDDVAQDPMEELALLQAYGKEILLIDGIYIPDSAYLENLSMNGVDRTNYEDYLSSSDRQDLAIGRRVLTTMLLERHND